jgi:hypothetical protein
LIDVRVLFYYGYKGGTGLITKGELIKDTLKISTKGEFFYIRTSTNYKAGTTEVWLGNTISQSIYICFTSFKKRYIE